MPKITESDIKELFGIYDQYVSATSVAGSPQRFVRKWIARINALHNSGLIQDNDPTLSDSTRIKKFINWIHSHPENRTDDESEFRIRQEKLTRAEHIGFLHAVGKFNELERKMIDSRVSILEALAATNAWLDSRKEALESRKQNEEELKREKAIIRLRDSITRIQVNLQTEWEKMQELRIELEKLETRGKEE